MMIYNIVHTNLLPESSKPVTVQKLKVVTIFEFLSNKKQQDQLYFRICFPPCTYSLHD